MGTFYPLGDDPIEPIGSGGNGKRQRQPGASGQAGAAHLPDARMRRPVPQGQFQRIEGGRIASGGNFHTAVVAVSNPSTQAKVPGLLLNKPAEANALHLAVNIKARRRGTGIPTHQSSLAGLQAWRGNRKKAEFISA